MSPKQETPQGEAVTERSDRFKALSAGSAAYEGGLPPVACPHRGSEERARVLRRYWVKGYMNARNARVAANRAAVG